ncbi:hypothetical protein ACQ4PT_055523 [Festuca glaucescens]
MDCGIYCIRYLVKYKLNGRIWNIVSVYGAPHNKDKEVFLIELVHVLHANSFPFVVGGDFNIIRKSSESNKPRRMRREVELQGKKKSSRIWLGGLEVAIKRLSMCSVH